MTDYTTAQQMEDNIRHAMTLHNVWAERGVDVEVVVTKYGIQTRTLDGTSLAHRCHKPTGGALMMADIERQISDDLGVSVEQMKGLSRKRDVCWARHEAMFRMFTEIKPRPSYLKIGRRFGRDHTTVIHGIRSHAKRMGLADPIGTEAVG
jgi:chromosomal replication initiation ATPase DnaA